MNSSFLSSIGLGGIDIGYVLLGLLVVSVVLLILLVIAFVQISK